MFKFITNLIEDARTSINIDRITSIRDTAFIETPYDDVTIHIGNIKSKYLAKLYAFYNYTTDNGYLICKDAEEKQKLIELGIEGSFILDKQQYVQLVDNSFYKIPRSEFIIFHMMPSVFYDVDVRSAYSSRPKSHRHWWWVNNE